MNSRGNDPIFETDVTKLTEFVYYIKDSVSLDNIPKIKPILISTEFDGESQITGFAVLDGLGFSDSNKKVFI